MNVIDAGIQGVKIIEPVVFNDERGYFYESFNKEKFERAIARNVVFVQDNQSKSVRGVLRGLHYQIIRPQGKLVRCCQGEVFDVAVDMRRCSPTFGRWIGVVLSEHNKRQLWVPEGFAHGFLVISDVAELLYKCTDYRVSEYERSVLWNDPDIGIDWPRINEIQLSQRDRAAAKFALAEVFNG